MCILLNTLIEFIPVTYGNFDTFSIRCKLVKYRIIYIYNIQSFKTFK